MLDPLLEVDEVEIADNERWRCKGNNGGVNAIWELRVGRLTVGSDGGRVEGQDALLIEGEFATGRVRGGQGVAEPANDSVAVAEASTNIPVVATSAHETWSFGAAQYLPDRPSRPILRDRSL